MAPSPIPGKSVSVEAAEAKASRALQPLDQVHGAAEPASDARGASHPLNWVLQRELYMDMLILLDALLLFAVGVFAAAATVYGSDFGEEHLFGVTAVGVVTATLFVSFQFLLGGYRRHNEVNTLGVLVTSGKTLFLSICVLWLLEHTLIPSVLDFDVIYMHFISVPQAVGLLAATGLSAVAQLHMAREVSAAYSSSSLQPRRIAIIGDPNTAAQFLNRLPLWRWGYEMVGFFCDTSSALQMDEVKSNTSTARVRGIENLVELARSERLDDILVATADNDDVRLNETLDAVSILPVRIYATPSLAVMSQRGLRQAYLGSQPVFEMVRPGIYGRRLILKRAMDLVIAFMALPIFMVIAPLIALAIKLESPGPVFFRQPRQGYNDQVFKIFKFRTMRVQETGQAVKQATKNDPRVTRVGKILRKLSLDELPQLINVLRGDMSIVGPRPQVAKQNYYYSDFITRYARRHTVLPGITGWAQISGLRGETQETGEMEARVKYDIYYVENWSLTLDLYILFRTLFVFFSKKAY